MPNPAYFALNSLYCLTPMFVQEVKVLLITYFALNSLIILVLAIGAVLAYVFREQVKQKFLNYTAIPSWKLSNLDHG